MFYYIWKKPSHDLQRLANICKDKDLISLDIFDTTLIRLTDKPTDIFGLMEDNAERLGVEKFKEKRITAQAKVESRIGVRTNLDKIYLELESLFYIKYDVCIKLKQLEIKTEIENVICDKEIISLIAYCKSRGKKVIFTSDMYLSSEDLKMILAAKGIIGYDEIVVSNELGKSKAEGSLYKLIYMRYKNSCTKFIHIGDNFRSDCFNSLMTKHYSCVFIPKQKQGVYKRILNNQFKQKASIEYEWGFRFLAPALFGFCAWIEEEAKKRETKKMLFLTREGAFIKKVFDIYDSPCSANTEIFYVSRRSIIAALSDVDWQAVCKYIDHSRCTVKDVQDLFELDTEMMKSIIYDLQLKNVEYIYGMKQKEIFFERIKNQCFTYSIQQRNLLKRYVERLGISGTVGIIDIGWRGSMQYYLQKLFRLMGINAKLVGLYFGEYSEDNIKGEKYGYLCSEQESKHVNDVINASFILESSLMPGFGTTLKYAMKGNDVEPVLSNDFIRGKEIKEIQKGILDAFKVMSQYKRILCKNYREPIKPLLQSLDYPEYRLACSLGDIAWRDVEEVRYIAKPQNMLEYLKSPKNLISDIQRSGWNSAFCLRLFKLPFPYFIIYNILKGIQRKRT